MGQKNGYIQVEISGKSAVCHIYPPTDGGLAISSKEAEEYLASHGFKEYDVMLFRSKLLSGNIENVPLGDCDGLQFSESMTAKVSLDKMKVTARFYPPSVNGSFMTTQDILAYLDKLGVKYGINQEIIADHLQKREFFTDILIAQGKEPRHGRDARIEYFFNTNPDTKPKHNDDGSVDYKDLNTICKVFQGDLLARLHPEDRGDKGVDVTGKEILPRSVKALRIEHGKNIRESEDKTEVFSEVTGHVTLTDGKIFVSNVFEVPADVDNSTGNINYDGNVHVHGNVRSGFTIRAHGDIVVDGVVEDAYLQASGQIIVKCGIHGMNKGTLQADGNVICMFIENAKVNAGGYVEAGSIIYSDVSASTDVVVSERKGFIVGGVVRAGGKVTSQTIGSPMGASTTVEVGMDPEKKKRFSEIQQDLSRLRANVEKITPVVNQYQNYMLSGKQLDQKNQLYFRRLTAELNATKEAIIQTEKEYHKLQTEMTNSKYAKIVVLKDAHPGVHLTISEVSITLKDKRTYGEFMKEDGEITYKALL